MITLEELEQQKINRKLWVAALRSGEYTQATEVLEDRNGGMCCLGVLAKIAGCDRIEVLNPRSNVGASYDNDEETAPRAAMDWVGLQNPSGDFYEKVVTVDKHGQPAEGANLAILNDRGLSFAQIADIIESEPDGLFYVEGVDNND